MVPRRNIAGAGLVGKGMRGRSLGVLFATTTAVTWGGQFVVGKSALETVNAFPLSTVRYAVAAALWLVVLVAVEGRDALRLDGRGLRLLWLGSLGFAGFNLLAYLFPVLVVVGGGALIVLAVRRWTSASADTASS